MVQNQILIILSPAKLQRLFFLFGCYCGYYYYFLKEKHPLNFTPRMRLTNEKRKFLAKGITIFSFSNEPQVQLRLKKMKNKTVRTLHHVLKDVAISLIPNGQKNVLVKFSHSSLLFLFEPVSHQHETIRMKGLPKRARCQLRASRIFSQKVDAS